MKKIKDLTPKPNISKTRIKDVVEKITSYNINKEKNAILSDTDSYIELAKILQPHIEPLNNIEAKIIILKSREISVSDVVEGLIHCQNENCKLLNEFQIPIENMVNTEIESEFSIIGVFENKEEIFLEEDLDSLIIKDYEELDYSILEQNDKILKLNHTINCRKCNEIINIYIEPKDVISKMSIKGLYNDMYVLSRHTNNSFVELEKLLPFEREIYINLYKKEIEDTS